MSTLKQQIGLLGERAAQKYLQLKGYVIIERNYHSRFGEIDIIAKQRERFVFIEVKARTSINYGLPEQAVNLRKQKKVFKTIQDYFWKRKIITENYRFDVIAVFLNMTTKIAKIKHYESVIIK